MDPKKVSGKVGAQKKKLMMSIELKREIIKKNEQGMRVANLAREYGRSTSTICTVLKQKDSIMGITLAKGVTIMSKLRSSLHEKMEKLLMVWVKEKQLEGDNDNLTQAIICEKARAIYSDLLNQTPRTSTDEALEDSFKASRGWFDNFRKRTDFDVIRHDEAASSDESNYENNSNHETSMNNDIYPDSSKNEEWSNGTVIKEELRNESISRTEPLRLKRAKTSLEPSKIQKKSNQFPSSNTDLKIINTPIQKRNLPDDSDTYGRHVANKHRKYSAHTKSVVEHLINNILFNADMGRYESQSESYDSASLPVSLIYDDQQSENILV